MRKLVNGIVEFRKSVRPHYKETFARLAQGQAPDTLFIACSDSRVVPNLFASTDPGDLFVLRNVGNFVPPCGHDGVNCHDQSAAAAIEYSLSKLPIKNIIVCGHSECGAIQALFAKKYELAYPNLAHWLELGEKTLAQLDSHQDWNNHLSTHNKLSQLSVLQQLENLKTYPLVAERLQAGQLKIHGWWFELGNADVYAYEEDKHQFILIDENSAGGILQRLEVEALRSSHDQIGELKSFDTGLTP